jgi:hypothetical protein
VNAGQVDADGNAMAQAKPTTHVAEGSTLKTKTAKD